MVGTHLCYHPSISSPRTLLNLDSIPILLYIFIHTYNCHRFHRWIYHWTWCPLPPPYARISPPVTSWRRGRGMLLASRLLLLWVNYWSCIHLDLAPCLLSLCECHLYPSFFFWPYILPVCYPLTMYIPTIVPIGIVTTTRWVLRVRWCVDFLVLLLHVFRRRKHDHHRHQVSEWVRGNTYQQTNKRTNKRKTICVCCWICLVLLINMSSSFSDNFIDPHNIFTSHHNTTWSPNHSRLSVLLSTYLLFLDDSFLVAYSILGSHVFDQLTGWQPTQA